MKKIVALATVLAGLIGLPLPGIVHASTSTADTTVLNKLAPNGQEEKHRVVILLMQPAYSLCLQS